MKNTRVLIVDDHPFFCSGLSQWLNKQSGVTCCGEAGSVCEARKAVADLNPDVILMDLRLGDGDGLELIKDIVAEQPEIRIIALSQFDEDTYAHRALKAGGRGYLMKSEATDAVLNAIEKVMKGELYLSPRISSMLLNHIFPDPVSQNLDLAKLTDRELQVFQLLGSGLSTNAIAKRLHLSSKTIETYREHLKNKLNLPDSPALLRAATLWVESGRL